MAPAEGRLHRMAGKKIGSVIDAGIAERIRDAAVSQNKTLREVLEEALRLYLAKVEKETGPIPKRKRKLTPGRRIS